MSDHKTDIQIPSQLKTMLLFLLASLFVIYRIYLLIQLDFIPKIKQILQDQIDPAGYRDNASLLILSHFHIRFLLATTAVCLILFVLTLVVKPTSDLHRDKKSFRRPLFYLFAFPPLAAVALIELPMIFGYRFIAPELPGQSVWTYLPPKNYLFHILFLSVALGVYFADRIALSNKARWWSFLFLLSPVPLLWWSGFLGIIKTKRWSVWRPVLALLTFIPLFLAFILNQPISVLKPRVNREVLPPKNKPVVPSLYMTDGYEIRKHPEKPEIYLSGGQNAFGSFNVFKKTPEGWKKSLELGSSIHFNEAGFDFGKNKAYIFDAGDALLMEVDLGTLLVSRRYYLPNQKFLHEEGINLTVSEKNNELYLINNYGFAAVIDTQELKMKKKCKLFQGGDIQKILIDPSTNHLLVLANYTLHIYDSKTFEFIHSKVFNQSAMGMLLDLERNQLLVCFPFSARVIVYDYKSLKEKRIYNGPIGVRVPAIDSENKLLFLLAGNGALEIRGLETGELVDRIQLYPWARRLVVLPEFGEVIVTFDHTHTTLWHYLKKKKSSTALDMAFSYFDRLISNSLQYISENTTLKLFNIPSGLKNEPEPVECKNFN